MYFLLNTGVIKKQTTVWHIYIYIYIWLLASKLYKWWCGNWIVLSHKTEYAICIFCCDGLSGLLAVVNGQIKRPQDDDIQSNVLEIVGSNIQSTYITCPADPAATLGIKLPFLVMIVKNLKKYFTFEIQVLDDKNVRRRFRASNFQVCKSAQNSIFLCR